MLKNHQHLLHEYADTMSSLIYERGLQFTCLDLFAEVHWYALRHNIECPSLAVCGVGCFFHEGPEPCCVGCGEPRLGRTNSLCGCVDYGDPGWSSGARLKLGDCEED